MNINWTLVAQSLENKAKGIRQLQNTMGLDVRSTMDKAMTAEITRAVLSGLADSIRCGLTSDIPE